MPAEIKTWVQYVDMHGQRLRVAIRPGHGEACPLLLLNGIGASLELLEFFADALGESIETIRVDLPSTGESPAPIISFNGRHRRTDSPTRSFASWLRTSGLSLIGNPL
jgi:hypothetical protein